MTHAVKSSSEEKLKAIWELAGDAMVFLDADGLLDCNDAALSLFGIDSSEQAVGVPLSAFAPRHQSDGRPSSEVFADGRLRALESGVGKVVTTPRAFCDSPRPGVGQWPPGRR